MKTEDILKKIILIVSYFFICAVGIILVGTSDTNFLTQEQFIAIFNIAIKILITIQQLILVAAALILIYPKKERYRQKARVVILVSTTMLVMLISCSIFMEFYF